MTKFFPDDVVLYVGSKYPELSNKRGWVVATVDRDPNVYVVEFDGAKDSDYIMPSTSLAIAKDIPNKEGKDSDKLGTIEIRRNRRRASEEE